MKKLIFLLLIGLLISIPARAQEEITSKVDAMIGEYLEMDLFSGTVLIARNGSSIYEKSFGFSDRENGRENNTKTKFDLGSLNKLFTGAAILKLNEMNKLKLDDNIGKYLNCFADEILRKVTIRHLLKHESGFGDYLNSREFAQNSKAFKKVNDLLRIIKEEKIQFEPGSRERYSNSGYVVLGAIIESVIGTSYFETIENMILNPLNMEETYFKNTDLIADKAKRYERDFEGNIHLSQFDVWPSPAGSGYSCPNDALKFIQNILYVDKLLSDNSKQLLLTRFAKTSPKDLSAIMSDPKESRGWAGGAPGVNTIIRQSLKDNYSIIIFSNYSPPAAMDIASRISTIIEKGSFNPPQLPLNEKLYKNFRENGGKYILQNFEQLITGYRLRGPRHLVLNDLGYNLFREGKKQEAIRIFELNVKLFPNEANTYDSLAEAFMMNGNTEKAIEFYEKTLKINPGNTNARENLKKLKGTD